MASPERKKAKGAKPGKGGGGRSEDALGIVTAAILGIQKGKETHGVPFNVTAITCGDAAVGGGGFVRVGGVRVSTVVDTVVGRGTSRGAIRRRARRREQRTWRGRKRAG